ncbi:hypothetical protein BFH97_18445 [Salmonella enterica]|nr:hypothetical protein [Salmonella enterica]
MKLYIANTTKQRHDFAWRKPETGRLVYHPINAGSQAVVIDGNVCCRRRTPADEHHVLGTGDQPGGLCP